MGALMVMMVLMGTPATPTVDDISDAIAWLCRTNPRHQMIQNEEARRQMAADIHSAATEYGHDPYLIATMAFYESAYHIDAEGALGEIGLLQVGPHVRKACERDGFEMEVGLDQLRCGARHLRRQIDRCGSIECGLTAYATSQCSSARQSRAARAVTLRLWMSRKLAKRPWEEK